MVLSQKRVACLLQVGGELLSQVEELVHVALSEPHQTNKNENIALFRLSLTTPSCLSL